MLSRNWSLSLQKSARAWRMLLAALLLPAALAGCGFQPIAASSSTFGEQDLVLAQLDVNSSDSRFAYRLKKEMLRSIAIDPSATQSLSLSATISRAGLAIEQNDTITRRNVTATTSYALASKKDQSVGGSSVSAKTGSTTVTTAVNTSTSQYSASVSDREAVERLAKETAIRMVTFLRVNRDERADGY